MKKTSKIIVCALFIPAGPAFAVTAVSVIPETRSIPVTSAMTEKLSETAAGLSAAEAGDNAKAEALLARLYSGGTLKESAAPVYSTIVVPTPASGAAVPVELGALPAQAPASVEASTAVPVAAAPAAAAPPSAAELAERTKDAAAEAAKEKEEEAAKLKMFKSGVGMMLLALLLIMLLL